LINKHKIRYWLSVGAQPTGGVVRVLSKYGTDFFPKYPIPYGKERTYEKPERKYGLMGYRKNYRKTLNKNRDM